MTKSGIRKNGSNDSSDCDDASASVQTPQTSVRSTSVLGGDDVSSYDFDECGVEQTIFKVQSSQAAFVTFNLPGSSRRLAVLDTLKSLGVKAFVIDGNDCANTGEVLKKVKRIVNHIARQNRVRHTLGFERALLYQDDQGRLFNLLLPEHAVGPAELWKNYLDSFSGLEAMIALLVLVRSFPCATSGEGIAETFKPATLSLLLGLVLTEETSLSWLNASMLIRATPSVAAHTLFSPVAPDVLRKLVIFVLVLASASTGQAQLILTLLGICGACLVLLANMGSRAWHFMRWKPQRYSWHGAGLLAYVKAVLMGIVFPYLGHRDIMVGGKAAIEYVIRTSFLAALAFMVSDVDEIQRFLVIGSDQCEQTTINLVVGVWFFLTLVICLCVVRQIPFVDQKPSDAERLLEPDQSSPAGFRVPSLPDYEIDPSLAQTGLSCCSLNYEFATGILMAFALSGGMIYFTS